MVFHEAAIPSVPRSIDDPVPSHEVNIDGTFNVLRAAKEGKVGRVVYAASVSAYGDTLVLPKVETMLPQPKIALRPAKAGGRILLQHLLRRATAWRRCRCATSTSTARGRIRPAPTPACSRSS